MWIDDLELVKVVCSLGGIACYVEHQALFAGMVGLRIIDVIALAYMALDGRTPVNLVSCCYIL